MTYLMCDDGELPPPHNTLLPVEGLGVINNDAFAVFDGGERDGRNAVTLENLEVRINARSRSDQPHRFPRGLGGGGEFRHLLEQTPRRERAERLNLAKFVAYPHPVRHDDTAGVI